MPLLDELKEPWGLLVAGLSGGMAWALVGTSVAALPVGIAVGAGVLGVKVVSALAMGGQDAPVRPARPAVDLPRPPRGSAAALWLERAELAVASLDDLADTAGTGVLATSVDSAVQEAADTLGALRRLGAQATAVEGALRRVDGPGLDAESERLRQAAGREVAPGVQQELARSLAALDGHRAVRDRLRSARDVVLARMQAVALGLEGLVARLAEVLALAETAGGLEDTAGEVVGLAHELEGLRQGLAETEAVSRGALDAAPLPDPGRA